MSTAVSAGVLSDRWAGTGVRSAVLILAGAALTGLLAQVSIPLPGTPVPLTLQTLGVLMTGAVLGSRRGVASMGIYVGLGMLGVPWFAGQSSGVHVATLGYLVGFIIAAGIVGRLAAAGQDRAFWTAARMMVLGNLVIYATGVPVLAWALGVGLPEALLLGVVPFLLGDAVKIAVAAGLLPAAWSAVSRSSR